MNKKDQGGNMKDKHYAKKPATHIHKFKVEDLTIGQLMFMANDGIVDDNLLDNLYYDLLDSKKVRNYLNKKD